MAAKPKKTVPPLDYKPPVAPDQGEPRSEVMERVAEAVWRADTRLRYGWEVEHRQKWAKLPEAERNSWRFYALGAFLAMERMKDEAVYAAGREALAYVIYKTPAGQEQNRGEYVVWGSMIGAAINEKPF